MPNVSDIMSIDVQSIEPTQTLRAAAELMQTLEVGALPVCEGANLVGMITDRDITVRCVALGLDVDSAIVGDVMSTDVQFCTEEQDTQEVMRVMGDKQVRRLPVVDLDRKLIGIVSVGDLALRQPGQIDETIREISAPSAEDPS
jgi:CBS domain-containing protein